MIYKSLSITVTLISQILAENLFQESQPFDGINGLIGAFVDFDFNRVTDVLLITENGCSIELAEGFQSKPYLRINEKIKFSFGDKCRDRIIGVIPADFSGDANIDLLIVTTRQSHVLNQDINLKLWLIKANQTNLEYNATVPLVKHIKSFPSTLDYDGDMITDFIVETNECSKELWTKLKPKCLTDMLTNQTMRYPNSNAFIDLSRPQDLRPDIVISGKNQFEYWFNDKGFHNKSLKFYEYPNRTEYQFVGQSTFADINFDGIVEHLIPVCKSFVYTCEGPQILVLSQSGSTYQWLPVLALDLTSNLTFIEPTLLGTFDFFVSLKVGDMDADGYPDIVTIMKDPTDSTPRVVFLKNYPSNNVFGRQFDIGWISEDPNLNLTTPLNIYLVSIFDFEEDGELDILVGSEDKNNYYLTAYINNCQTSSYFLKVHVSTGICHSDCPHIASPLIGAQLCFSPSEGRQVGCSGQLSQTSHFALQLPFVLFGLGDIPNFVENLSISIPSGQLSARSQTWYEIVPDSRIVIIPYPADKSKEWVQKLYLDPKYFAFPTIITLISICCLLIVIIAGLHRRDLRQDIIEHKEYKKHWL